MHHDLHIISAKWFIGTLHYLSFISFCAFFVYPSIFLDYLYVTVHLIYLLRSQLHLSNYGLFSNHFVIVFTMKVAVSLANPEKWWRQN